VPAQRKPALRHYAELVLMVAAEWMVRPLPRRLTVRVAGGIGRMLMALRVRRRDVEKNLAIAFGPAPPGDAGRTRLIRTSYQHTVLTILEFLQHAVHRREIVSRIEREEVVAPLLRAGPILMVTGHIGNWEAFGTLLAEYGHRGAMLAKPLHNPLLQKRILGLRTRLREVEIILTGSSMMSVVDCVRQGKSVGFVADQDAGRTGLFVEYFGRPASTARGPAAFAVKLGLPLVPMFMVRDATPERRLELHVGEPLYADAAADGPAEVKRLTEAYTRQLEDAVREHPADYFWLHRRWKTQPPAPATVSSRFSLPHGAAARGLRP
jgi:KDO2-lipid IV(A) lauroyltransferase